MGRSYDGTAPPPCLARHLPMNGEEFLSLLFAFEFGLPLFSEGLDALVGVRGDENAADRFALEGEAQVKRSAVALGDRELGVAEGHARSGRDPGRVVDRFLPARGRIGKQAV